MPDCINRDDLLKAAWDKPTLSLSVYDIGNIKPVDVAPVRHGRWICIRKGYEEYECSVCRGVDSNCSDYYGTHVVTEQEYCPFCGATMDQEADHDQT